MVSNVGNLPLLSLVSLSPWAREIERCLTVRSRLRDYLAMLVLGGKEERGIFG